MDILLVNYVNYDLLDMNLNHWNKIKGEKNYLICDVTPEHLKKKINIPVYENEYYGIDGEIHGSALDFLVKKSKSDIIAICDTDFFWTNNNILYEIEQKFSEGYKCIGCEGFYRDWVTFLDTKHPDRKGSLAPVCWGMFIDRNLALSETFVVTNKEGSEIRETGWRVREKIIKEKIPNITFKGNYDNEDTEVCYFSYNNTTQGVHILKGSSYRADIATKKSQFYINKYTKRILL